MVFRWIWREWPLGLMCIVSVFTEMMNSDCMLERDYQGWVDFGRRDAD